MSPFGVYTFSCATPISWGMPSWWSTNWPGLLFSVVLASLLLFSPVRRRIEQFNETFEALDRERAAGRLNELRARLYGLESGPISLHFHRRVAGGLLAITGAFALIFWGFVLRQGDIKGMTWLVFLAFGVAVWCFGSALDRLNQNGAERPSRADCKVGKAREKLTAGQRIAWRIAPSDLGGRNRGARYE